MNKELNEIWMEYSEAKENGIKQKSKNLLNKFIHEVKQKLSRNDKEKLIFEICDSELNSGNTFIGNYSGKLINHILFKELIFPILIENIENRHEISCDYLFSFWQKCISDKTIYSEIWNRLGLSDYFSKYEFLKYLLDIHNSDFLREALVFELKTQIVYILEYFPNIEIEPLKFKNIVEELERYESSEYTRKVKNVMSLWNEYNQHEKMKGISFEEYLNSENYDNLDNWYKL